MKRKTAVNTGIFLCLAFLLAACQQTPKEVSERMSGYGDNAQMSSDDIQYCTLSELQKTDIKDIHVSLDNMVLPDQVDFSQIESVSTLELSFETNYTDERGRVAEVFGIDSGSLAEQPKDYQGRQFMYEADGTYFVVCDDGFFSYFTGLDWQEKTHRGFQGQYDLDTEDVSGKSIEFGNGEKAEISEMCQKAEQWMNENIPLNGCRYHVTDAYVRELETKEGLRRQLSLGVDISYKGIRFNNYASSSGNDPATHGIFADYDNVDMLSGFSIGTGLLKVDSEKPVEKLVDFESAVKLANEKVSGFNQNKITKILPLYMLQPEYETEKQVYSVPGQKVKARPVYAFMMKREDDSSEFGINKCNVYQVVAVDMVTGEVAVYFGGDNS